MKRAQTTTAAFRGGVAGHAGRALLLATAMAFGPTLALAQGFPSRPVRIVVPFPAGGSFDITARVLAQRMQLGQTVIVENRPGGGTVIGTEHVARSPADGHTVLMIGPSFTMHSALRSVVPSATPAGVVARLNAETVKVLSQPEVRDSMRAQGLIAAPSTPEQFAALLKSDAARYGRIAREANVRLD